MLVAEGLVYRHAGAPGPSLRGIDLELRDGEVVGLVGPNDAGKTTLCLVMAGLAPRVIGGTLRGRLLLDGEDAVGLSTYEMAARVTVELLELFGGYGILSSYSPEKYARDVITMLHTTDGSDGLRDGLA